MGKIFRILCVLMMPLGLYFSSSTYLSNHVQSWWYEGHWCEVKEVANGEGFHQTLPGKLKYTIFNNTGVFYADQLVGVFDAYGNYISLKQFKGKNYDGDETNMRNAWVYGTGMLIFFVGFIVLFLDLIFSLRRAQRKKLNTK